MLAVDNTGSCVGSQNKIGHPAYHYRQLMQVTMLRPGVRQVPEGSEEQGRMEKTGCKIICGAPTTLAVKGLMMMMMMSAH